MELSGRMNCCWWDENDDDPPCEDEGTFTTCDPVGGVVCAKHKCRCSQPILQLVLPFGGTHGG